MHSPPCIPDGYCRIWQSLVAVIPGEMNAMFAEYHQFISHWGAGSADDKKIVKSQTGCKPVVAATRYRESFVA